MKTRPPNAQLLAVMLVSMTMLVSMCLDGGDDEEEQEVPDFVGRAAPAFSVTDVDGGTHNLSDYGGRVLVIEFFATWCGPCKVQLKTMKELRPMYSEEEVAFLHIDTDDSESKEEVSTYRDDNGIPWPVAYQGGDVAVTYEVRGIPTIVIINQQGTATHYYIGTTGKSVLQQAIDGLV